MIKNIIIVAMAICIAVLSSKQGDETTEEAFTRVGKNVYAPTIKIFRGNLDNG